MKLHQEKAWEMQGTTNSHQKKRKEVRFPLAKMVQQYVRSTRKR